MNRNEYRLALLYGALLMPSLSEAGPLNYYDAPVVGSHVSTAFRGVIGRVFLLETNAGWPSYGTDLQSDNYFGTGAVSLYAAAEAVGTLFGAPGDYGSGSVAIGFTSEVSSQRISGALSAAGTVTVPAGINGGMSANGGIFGISSDVLKTQFTVNDAVMYRFTSYGLIPDQNIAVDRIYLWERRPGEWWNPLIDMLPGHSSVDVLLEPNVAYQFGLIASTSAQATGPGTASLGWSYEFSFEPAPIPEPSTWIMAGLASIGVVPLIRRRRRRAD